MLDFSSIAPHLQVSIAEKIDYFDQKQFELSSKSGKQVLECTKHAAVVDCMQIRAFNDKVYQYESINLLDDEDYRKTLSGLCKLLHLPRFDVFELKIESLVPTEFFMQICEHRLVGELHLIWKGMDGSDPFFPVLLELLNIKALKLEDNGPLDEALFSTPKFCEISPILFTMGSIPDEKLLKLQSDRITLYSRDEDRNCVTANLFFKEWFSEKRNIELFEIRSTYTRTNQWQSIDWINVDALFSGLPYEVIWKYRQRSGIIFPDYGYLRQRDCCSDCDDNCVEELELDKNVTVYSIDRGDRKLLVYVGSNEPMLREDHYDFLQAQEYTELDDVFSYRLDVK